MSSQAPTSSLFIMTRQSSDPPILLGHWSIERAPSRRGPWRAVKSLHQADVWSAIRAGHEVTEGETWLRLVPDGKVNRAILVKS